MKTKQIFEAAINKWNAIAQTNDGFGNKFKIEEVELDNGWAIKISNSDYVQGFTYKGEQSKDAIKQYAYEMLLEQCVFDLLLQNGRKKLPSSLHAVVFFERGVKSLDIPYDSTKSVEELVYYFREETRIMAKCKYPIVFHIQKVFIGDKTTYETIYLNSEVWSTLAKG